MCSDFFTTPNQTTSKKYVEQPHHQRGRRAIFADYNAGQVDNLYGNLGTLYLIYLNKFEHEMKFS